MPSLATPMPGVLLFGGLCVRSPSEKLQSINQSINHTAGDAQQNQRHTSTDVGQCQREWQRQCPPGSVIDESLSIVVSVIHKATRRRAHWLFMCTVAATLFMSDHAENAKDVYCSL